MLFITKGNHEGHWWTSIRTSASTRIIFASNCNTQKSCFFHVGWACA
jgi:hypothetical protein